MAATNALAMLKASRPTKPLSSRWMARSAPLASPSRSTCCARAGPAVTTTTSPVCFSFCRRASSRAYASLVHLVGNIFPDPCTRFIQLQRSILLRHLLHADQNLHGLAPALLVPHIQGKH